MTRFTKGHGAVAFILGVALAAGVSAGTPAQAKMKKAPKPAAVKKFKPMTFMCIHGCKKNITVKSAADKNKVCPVCGCKQKTSACKGKK